MTIKVIGAGFGRTGTLSLKAALETLGFGPCYHMQEIVPFRPLRAKTWYEASRGQTVDWKKVFSGYQATVDWPASYFYRDLTNAYPNAKVILTVRDPERWYRSAHDTIYRSAQSFSAWQWYVPITRYVPMMLHDVIWEGTFHGRFDDKTHALAVFNRHIEEVKRLVPPDRLLVYHVGEGWEPLCRFLGVPVPAGEAFPHLNDTARFQRFIRAIHLTRSLMPVAVGGLVGLMVFRLLTRR